MAEYDSPTAFFDSGLRYDEPVTPATRRKTPMAQIKLNLGKLTIADLLIFTANIKAAMTGNSNFTTPAPNPPLASIGALITALTTQNSAYEAMLLNLKHQMALRDAAVADLIAAMNSLAGYVQSQANGDPAVILSAGMLVKAAPTPVGIPAQVLNFTLTMSDAAGELFARWKPVRGAKTYELQTSPDPVTDTSWKGYSVPSKAAETISGQPSGSKLWARVRANGAAGPGPWSDITVKIVP